MMTAAAEGGGRNGEQLERQRKAARNERRHRGAMVFTARRKLGRQSHIAVDSGMAESQMKGG